MLGPLHCEGHRQPNETRHTPREWASTDALQWIHCFVLSVGTFHTVHFTRVLYWKPKAWNGMTVKKEADCHKVAWQVAGLKCFRIWLGPHLCKKMTVGHSTLHIGQLCIRTPCDVNCASRCRFLMLLIQYVIISLSLLIFKKDAICKRKRTWARIMMKKRANTVRIWI